MAEMVFYWGNKSSLSYLAVVSILVITLVHWDICSSIELRFKIVLILRDILQKNKINGNKPMY